MDKFCMSFVNSMGIHLIEARIIVNILTKTKNYPFGSAPAGWLIEL